MRELGPRPADPAVNVAELRADTPGCEKRIHLNNAGAALMPRPVLNAVTDHFRLEAELGGYEAAIAAADAVEDAYRAVAELVGARARNVAFTEHATSAFVAALSSIRFGAGDRIVATRADYVSNHLQFISLAERFGVEVVVAPDLPEGGVDPDALASIVHRQRPRLVTATHVPTSSGLVQDVAAVGRICRARGVTYLVDACQSVGQMPLDVGEIGCDFLSATARKFLRGPRGAGFLYVSDRVLDSGLHPLFPDLRGASWIAEDLYQPDPSARRFETWEFAWGLALGMGEAARYALDLGLDRISGRVRALADRLRRMLAELPGVRVLDRGAELSAIVTASVEGREPRELAGALRREGVNATGQGRADALLDYDAKGVEGALRLSPHCYNTVEELERTVALLSELAGQARTGFDLPQT